MIVAHASFPGDNEEGPSDEPAEAAEPYVEVKREDLQRTLEFIDLLKNASLDSEHCGLRPEDVARLRNPIQEELKLPDADVRLSIKLFIALGNVSLSAYEEVAKILNEDRPELNILSAYKVSMHAGGATLLC